MSQPKNAISCSPDEQRTEKRVIHRADNPCSPGESVRSNLIRPVNNKSLTNSPRELVTTIPARLVVRPVNTLKGLPGGARFLLSGFTAFRLLAPGSGSTSFQGLRPERRELHGAHPMRPLHPMHAVHQCSRFTTTVRDHAGTAWNGGAVENLRRLGPRPTVPCSSRIHSWPDDPKGGAIEAA